MRLEDYLGFEYYLFIGETMEEIQSSSIFNLKQLGDTEIDVCNYVVKNLKPMDIGKINYGRKIDIDELKLICLSQLELFDIDITLDVTNLLCSVPINWVSADNILNLQAAISYFTDSGVVIEDTGSVYEYTIPKNIYQLTGYFLGHEQIHALKDTNYREFINQMVVGEVIPIFYELMIYNPEDILKKELIKCRVGYIFENSFEYSLLHEELKLDNLDRDSSLMDNDSKIKKMIYEYSRSKVGVYLNSFYYALILYNMYKQTPKKILDMVSRVLKHDITTMEMLEQLGIYGDIRGEIFEGELRNIKKLVR